MKYKYTFHPEEYAVGANERHYSEMAARGWHLEKRGAWLSKFRRGEPQQTLYRIEFSTGNTMLDDAPGLPDEQVALYEECGWTLCCSIGLLNIFSAPAGSGAPEFYSDPRQQADSLKMLRRKYCWSWLPVVLVLGIYMIFIMALDRKYTPGEWLADLHLTWVRGTSILPFYFIWLVRSIYQMIHGMVCTSRLYRRLRAGIPIDHAPRRPIVHRFITRSLAVLCAVFIAMQLAQLIGIKKYPMPAQADGPYVVLKDMGWDGPRTTNYLERESEVETGRSMAAEQWYTYECVENAMGHDVWLYQDVYIMHSEEQAMRLVPAVMHGATFARSPEGFEPVTVEGLDAAWVAGLEAVAVRGNTVWYLTYSESDWIGAGLDELLACVAALETEE